MEKLFKRSICWAAPEGHWHQQADGKPGPWLPFTLRTEETEEFVRNWARHYLRSYPKVQCVFIWPVDQSTEPERITRATLGIPEATDATADELTPTSSARGTQLPKGGMSTADSERLTKRFREDGHLVNTRGGTGLILFAPGKPPRKLDS